MKEKRFLSTKIFYVDISVFLVSDFSSCWEISKSLNFYKSRQKSPNLNAGDWKFFILRTFPMLNY